MKQHTDKKAVDLNQPAMSRLYICAMKLCLVSHTRYNFMAQIYKQDVASWIKSTAYQYPVSHSSQFFASGKMKVRMTARILGYPPQQHCTSIQILSPIQFGKDWEIILLVEMAHP